LAGVTSEDDLDAGAVWMEIFANPRFTWDDITWLRQLTDLPLIVKGICLPSDGASQATRCRRHRVLQSWRSASQRRSPRDLSFEPIIEAAGGVPVTFDSGIRCGVDVLRAYGLGAALVGIGRPYVYGLAVGGRDGLRTVVLQILAEADLTMAVDCYTDLEQLPIERLD
jgi:lactate 2-monooxygenase